LALTMVLSSPVVFCDTTMTRFANWHKQWCFPLQSCFVTPSREMSQNRYAGSEPLTTPNKEQEPTPLERKARDQKGGCLVGYVTKQSSSFNCSSHTLFLAMCPTDNICC
jgi:hypothetical protein